MEKVISEWNRIYNDNLNATLINAKSFIDYPIFSNKNFGQLNNFKVFTDEILVDYSNLLNDRKKINQELSCDFNPLRYFSIGETLHSYLLADLLNPNSTHGQNDLFLLSFLELLGIENPQKGQWKVTAEKQRIDILLKRANPHSVVIIENKSNYASDQENQLYRYWHNQIYKTNPSIDYTKPDEIAKNYQIIYLTPSDWKTPSENSLLRPKELKDFLPNKIPLTPKIVQFNPDLIQWLETSLKKLSTNNNRLREYLKQYIELWT